jgi:hypothetical protein
MQLNQKLCWKSFSLAGAVILLVMSGIAQAETSADPPVVDPPDRIFLQQVGAKTATVKWRGGDADQVCYSRWPYLLNFRWWKRCVAAKETELGHKEARLSRLRPDRKYFYIIGEPGPGAVNFEQRFRTAPRFNRTPRDGNTRIWMIGDSGTETEQSPFTGEFTHLGEPEEVKQGFLTYQANSGGEDVDLFVLLGDNAYLEGTDSQWQGAFFDIYPNVMNKAGVWPTIGNHEMGGACFDLSAFIGLPPGSFFTFLGGTTDFSDPALYVGGPSDCSTGEPVPGADGSGPPYLDIFSLPTAGELGGAPSGTEQYYSTNYGNVHLVSLDGQLSNGDDDQRAAMADWLVADLSSNRRSWTIVIFHHPPYSKGENHNSDFEQREIDMREVFTPIFEDYGVDVVYGGHAHSYERSYYLNGHQGLSDTFDPNTHAELNQIGAPAIGQGNETYSQISRGSGEDDKVVYTVAGSSGKADELDPCEVDPETGEEPLLGCTRSDWLQHPAHYFSIAEKGSVVLDATRRRLTSRFIDVNGDVVDEFTIERGRRRH